MEDIGSRSPRYDAPEKVRGTEKFAADEYPPGMAWAGAVRAGIPHGNLLSVDTRGAEAIPGVIAVLTRRHITGPNRQGFVHWDMPVLCGTRIRYTGDPVALVLAESREILAQAIPAVAFRIDPLPVIDSLDRALKPDSIQIHDHAPKNILMATTLSTGRASETLAVCDVVISETFDSPVQEHGFLETQNGVAWVDDTGTIHLIVSTQAPHRDRLEVARALGLDPMKIHVRSPYLGGGFGGKDGVTVQCLLTLAAMHSGNRPVKMWWDREESILAGYKRHGARMRYRLGASRDGTLQALECHLDYDTGAYAHLGGEIMVLGLEHATGPYRVPHVCATGQCIYTNTPVAGAFRGFGVAQVSFAMEGMIDRLAAKLNRDPLSLRLQNALVRGDKNGANVTLTHSTGIRECLLRLQDHDFWKTRKTWVREAAPRCRRGVGISAVMNGMGYGRGLPDYAVAKIALDSSGQIMVYNGVSDMGQGNGPTFVQMAGELLCQSKENMTLVLPDTDVTLPSGSASAGRTTFTYGNALITACKALREKLFSRAALLLMAENSSGFAMIPGAVRHLPSGREISLADIAARLLPEDRVCVAEYFMPVTPEGPEHGGESVRFGFPHLIFPYAAHLARVEVDELTGCIRVRDYVAVTDGGRVLNPATYEQQVQGAVAQGLGYALFEEVSTADGNLLTKDFSTYIIPTSRDLPDIESHSVETQEHEGPFGMKGIGEVGLNGPLPAVASALAAAGIPMTRAPFTAERILEALDRHDAKGEQ